ncbi:GNAT family N-acetyltransferase [Flavisolibacter tropicus]|uniref:GNAT family acetyltransferase n=1 Tax=Flavisolibacter tropicus TaxID=1492898 RepID=A0A172TTV8_9BACT|nr:GNAT family N-acetyltransferase [Flavisolibacter tropicus]ANE50398.1 GNAT family acetyltransferase [Flavisolibacter tropicus]
MEGIEIKPYDDSLKQEVGALIVSIQHDEFLIPIDLEAQPDLKAIPSFYQVNNGNFWVAIYDNKVVGTIALLDIGDRMGALRKMFVHKDFRGKEWGVGQSLLNTLLDWAKKKNYATIYLGTTEKFVAAQRFYEKNSFDEVDKQLLPSTFPIMNVDVKFYKRSV